MEPTVITPRPILKGLRASIFKTRNYPPPKLNVVSHRCEEVTIISPPYDLVKRCIQHRERIQFPVVTVEPVCEVSDDAPAVVLCAMNVGEKVFYSLRPLDALREQTWLMFGGTLVHCSDSRFSKLNNGYALPLHDRIED